MTGAVLEIEGLTVRYGRAPPALREVTLSVARGETLGIVGESGSGKSTLSLAALGLLPPAAGRVRLFGQDLAGLDRSALHALRRRTQMVFQDPYASLNPTMTVGAVVAEPLVVHRRGGRPARAARVRDLLGLVGLRPETADRYPAQLSGGQRQRVAIARALALDPELVVCDEPVSALDVSVQAQILNLLRRLQSELQLALLFVSHDLAVVRYVAHRVAVIEAGELVELGLCEEVLRSPRHEYTKALLAAARARSRPRAAADRDRVAPDTAVDARC